MQEHEVPHVAGHHRAALGRCKGQELSVGGLIPVGTEFQDRDDVVSAFSKDLRYGGVKVRIEQEPHQARKGRDTATSSAHASGARACSDENRLDFLPVILIVGERGSQLTPAKLLEMLKGGFLRTLISAVHHHDLPHIQTTPGDVSTHAGRPFDERDPWIPKDVQTNPDEFGNELASGPARTCRFGLDSPNQIGS